MEKGDVDDSLLMGSWRKLVMQSPHVPSWAVDAKAYAFYVVEAFHQHLRDREIFAKGAKKWGNPAAGCLADDGCQRKKTSLLHTPGLVHDGESAQTPQRHCPQDAQGRPRRDFAGSLQMDERAQGIHLPVRCARTRVGFGHHALCALGGTWPQHGVRAVSGNGKGLGIDQVDHADREYCRPDNYAALSTLLLAMQDQIDLARQWGGGQLASVDGMNFVVPRTLFPARLSADGIPGITWLTMISDQATQLTGKVVTGTADRCLYVLDTFYEHHIRLDNKSRAASTQGDAPTAITGETGDHEDIAFGLLSLSGYAYAPTPAHLARTKLWRIDPTADYGPLQKATQARINLELIKRNWDNIPRLVCSVHSGTVRA